MTMKLKYIIIGVVFLALGYEIYRIEKQLSVVTLELTKTDRATITIPAMIEAPALDTTDLFIVADGGTVTRKLTAAKITGAIHDTATTLRSEMGTGGTFSGDTLTFTDGSRIFGGGGEIAIQPSAAVDSGDKLSVYTAGSGDTLIVNSNGSRLIVTAPVLEVTNYMTVMDSLFLDYIGSGSITGGVYLLLSPTQAIDTGRTDVASEGMRMPLRSIQEEVSDTVNGEMIWHYLDGGKLVETRGVVNSDPIATDEAHTIKIEYLTRYVAELETRIERLEALQPMDSKRSDMATIGILIALLIMFGVITYYKVREGKK